MNNDQFKPESIRPILDRATLRLEQPTLDRLHAARMEALDRQKVTSHAHAWSLPGNFSLPFVHPNRWAMATLALCLIGGAVYWEQLSDEHQQAEIDIAILTDELPVDVYLD